MSAREFFARAALFAYPAEFRSHFGDEMLADFEDQRPHLGSLAAMIVGGLAMRAEMLLRDAGYAARRLRAAPMFVAIVVLTFALGIGVNVAVFSVLDAVVLRPLPFVDASHVIGIRATSSQRPNSYPALSIVDVSDIRAQTRSVGEIAGAAQDYMTIRSNGKPMQLHGLDAMWPYFHILGIEPEIGRVLNASDERPGVNSVVISDALWRRSFGGDPSVIGRTLMANGTAYRIVGVTKPGQLFIVPTTGDLMPLDYLIALPDRATPQERGARYIGAIARLAPGATLDSAVAELRLVSARLAKTYPRDDAGYLFGARSMQAAVLGDAGSTLWTVFAAVLGILIIACANAANVIASRWSVRGREFALRRALGASSRRIAGQLFVEVAMLAALGGVAGIVLAYAGLQYLLASGMLRALPRHGDIAIDGTSLAYASIVVAATTFLAGIIPVFTSNDADLQSVLKTAGRGGGGHGARARSILVVSEIALTLAVVVVSGLMIRSFVALSNTPLGVRTQGLYSADVVGLPENEYATLAARSSMHRELLARLRALPGVRSAALTVQYPLGGVSLHFSAPIFGESYPPGLEPVASGNDVTPGYFATMGVPILRGRDFVDSDTADSEPVAIVNQAFVSGILHGRNPLGVRVRISGWNGTKAHWATIVGLAGNERERLTQPVEPMLYSPLAQVPANIFAAVVYAPQIERTALEREVADAYARTAPSIEPAGLATQDELLAMSTRSARTTATLLSVLSIVALVLALTGIFGVMSFSVSQRLHEFGVRIALGARGRDIVSDVLRRALVTTAVGIALGLVFAALSARAISEQLHDISPFDPLTFLAVVALLLVAACVAALQPAFRATRVEPATSLRYE